MAEKERGLGVLKEVDPRTVWVNEARDFTPWLKENIDLLAQVLGMDLEIDEIEGPVGDFAVDLIGRIVGSDQTIVIENQLRPTDHAHLGQLLTYAAGRGARAVVWISTHFREEHQQALDWLNESTGEEQSFFGVEIKVLQIDGSRRAPFFQVVSRPRGRKNRPVSKRGELYRAFWTDFLDKLRNRGPGLTKAMKGLPQSWCGIGAGRSGFAYGAAFTYNNRFKVELYIDTGDGEKNKRAFEWLYREKEEVEQELGKELSWERLENARASRVAVYTEGTIEAGEKELADLKEWGVGHVTEVCQGFREPDKET